MSFKFSNLNKTVLLLLILNKRGGVKQTMAN